MSQPLSRGYFRDHAAPKEFSTGSLGWHCGGKVTVMVAGVPVKVQVGINLTVVGSKELVQ